MRLTESEQKFWFLKRWKGSPYIESLFLLSLRPHSRFRAPLLATLRIATSLRWFAALVFGIPGWFCCQCAMAIWWPPLVGGYVQFVALLLASSKPRVSGDTGCVGLYRLFVTTVYTQNGCISSGRMHKINTYFVCILYTVFKCIALVVIWLFIAKMF